MLDALGSVPLTTGVVPVVAVGIGAIAGLWLLMRRPMTRWAPRSALAALLGVGLGYFGSWMIGDVLDLFGATPSFVTRSWFAFMLAGAAVVLLRIGTARRRRPVKRWLAVGFIPLFLLVGAVGINTDIGEFPTVDAMAGIGYAPIALPAISAPTSVSGTSISTAGAARVGSVVIPATSSGFRARSAMIYLPPAALVAHPPKLPVLIMMSGQPGSPAQLFRSGQLATLLTSYADAHNGLAPIVVAPDQLGAADRNPMCVNSPLGNSATYLTVDVVRWIRAHLNVLPGRDDWAVGGFSQGATCATQFGAGYPQLFGNILDIAGEVAPINGSRQNTVNIAFGGSDAAYRAAMPSALFSANSPFASTLGIFVRGSLDSRFGPGVTTVAAAAKRAGVDTHTLVSRGTAHDWHTVSYGFSHALDIFGQKWGFGA